LSEANLLESEINLLLTFVKRLASLAAGSRQTWLISGGSDGHGHLSAMLARTIAAGGERDVG
jgi:hypothetical protein